jgi:branched-chain amino acid transport system permease protein
MAVQEATAVPAGGSAVWDAINRQSGIAIAVGLTVLMLVVAFLLGVNPFGILIAGLTFGSLYAIVALGYTMVYGIIELINFAHGDVFIFGTYASLWLLERVDPQMATVTLQVNSDQVLLGIGYVVMAMLFSAVMCSALGVLVERVAYRPLRNAPRLAPLITAIGASFIIENVLLQWRGGANLTYPSIIPLTHPSIFTGKTLGSVDITTVFSNIDIITIVVAVIMMFLLDRFVNLSKLGKAMRSVAQDREASLMMGISVDRIIVVTFIVGSALAGVGSVIYGMDLGSFGFNSGFTLGLYAFTAAVLGGIGNIRGAMVGGLLIGMIQQFVEPLGNGEGTAWADPVVFAVLVLVLVFRPSGLLGAQIPDKV